MVQKASSGRPLQVALTQQFQLLSKWLQLATTLVTLRAALQGSIGGDVRPSVGNDRAFTVAIDANLIVDRFIGVHSAITPVGSVLKIAKAFIRKSDHSCCLQPKQEAPFQKSIMSKGW